MQPIYSLLFLLHFLFFFSSVSAAPITPIPADQVFEFSSHNENNHVFIAEWSIASGYYLYRDRFRFTGITADNQKIILPIKLPTGIPKKDSFLGNYEVYADKVRIPVALTPQYSKLLIEYQGCSTNGFCYPPMEVLVHPSSGAARHLLPQGEKGNSPQNLEVKTPSPLVGEGGAQRRMRGELLQRNNPLMFASFFLVGLLLSLTPCVLPMIPILSGIILKQKKSRSIWQAFSLSLAYVLGMASAYAIAGSIAGLTGNRLESALQNPIVISLFSLFFVALALSLFGLFHLRLPHRWQQIIHQWHDRLPHHTHLGIASLGALSVLIVSPCVTPPLVGVLAYISTTHDALTGALALFIMGLGMGVPLLIIGTLGHRYLPKTGPWMKTIKIFFGILLLAMATWMMMRLLPDNVRREQLPFTVVKTVQNVETARSQHKQILLYFYADWCVNCKTIEQTTFADPAVQKALKNFVLLKADVTKNDINDKALMHYFGVFAPPTMLFFNAEGKYEPTLTLIGNISAQQLLRHTTH